VTGAARRVVEAVKTALRVPVAWLIHGLARCSGRRAGLTVVYHRVGDPHQDYSVSVIPPLGTATFEIQIRHLARHYRVVPTSEIAKAAAARRRWQRFPVAITFDDDSPTHARDAMPILSRVGAPAAFFLAGASLDRPYAFWYERLQHAYERGLLDPGGPLADLPGSSPRPSSINVVAEAIKDLPPDEYDRVGDRLLECVGPDRPESAMPAADVRALVEAGFEIGFHTKRHYILPSLDDRALDRAMVEGRDELAAVVGSELSMIAYPNGDADARVASAARSAGFRLGFTADPVPVEPGTDPLLIGRVAATHHPSRGRFTLAIARALWARQPS
jgi:peptidoglycan/xylan/chitin deacetylase (PgdA/CDA1 family)